jgi:tetratricopeptide (TPR) repeat protein
VEEILHHAEQLEKEYDWSGAAGSYAKALNLLPQDDFSKMGKLHERLGYAFYRAAFQAENNSVFNERMRQAVAAYEKAKEFYERLSGSVKTPRILRSDAMTTFIGYWLAPEAHEKKQLIDDCWRLASEALKAFEVAGEGLEYGKTFNQLSKSADLSFCLEWNWQPRDRVIREAAKYGEQAIKSLSALQNDSELAKAYVKTADYLYVFGYFFLSREEQERKFEKARGYWQKAKELSEEAAVLESLSILEGLTLEFGAGVKETLRFYQKALEYGKKTADSFIVGCAFDLLAYHTAWSCGLTEDPDERDKLGEKALQYAAEAKKQYSNISFVGPGYGFLWVEEPYAEYYCAWAFNQTEPSERRDFLKKAAEVGPRLLERAASSGYPDAVWYAHHVMGRILTSSAFIEMNSEAKNKLLEEALRHRNEMLRVIEQAASSMYWERGGAYGGISAVKFQLAELASDSETKRKMILEAIKDLQECARLEAKGVISFEREDLAITVVGNTQYWCGLYLNRAYELTHDKEHLAKAVEAFEEAAGYFGKFALLGRVAECHWKIAQTYDALDEYLKAAEDFDVAADTYKRAVEKVPQLKDLYQDHALYMQAWSEIEKARHYHERQEYGLAKERFDKAADLHRSLKKWSYLTPNYFAWASVEFAEELSRKEHCEEAIQAFKEAVRLFDETKKSIQNELSKIEDVDEKRMANSMIKATSVRHEYCMARIALEQARKMDKEGDHYSSSEKYSSATEAFEKIGESAESDQERREIKFTISLSRAWQKMTLAEAEASPQLYADASELFEKAKDFCPNERTKMLVLGHSHFCRALEAGTKYVDTRDAAMHVAAGKHLASASNYYIRADFLNASEYAKATKLLFDAYAYTDNAERESDPDKKAKLYTMVEKVLQTSAGSFTKAEHPEKREQVLKLLEKTREERELATSLTEVLHAPSIVSTTRVLTAPTPTHEEAVGSERFEHADIQANLIVHQKELQVGEDLKLEIELVNAGRGPAVLVKLSDIIPTGFELVDKPEIYRVEDSYLNMKGKRLDSLRPEEIKITLKPKNQGIFQLKPRISYLDENGKYRFYEPEPVSITVKELGIKGWLKGER